VAEEKEACATAEVEFKPSPGNMFPGGPADFLRCRKARAADKEAERQRTHLIRVLQSTSGLHATFLENYKHKLHEQIPDLDPFKRTYNYLVKCDLDIPEVQDPPTEATSGDFDETTPTPLPDNVYKLILGIQTAYLHYNNKLLSPHLLLKDAPEPAATE